MNPVWQPESGPFPTASGQWSLWQVLWQRRLLVLLSTLAGLGAGAALCLLGPATYRSSAQVLVVQKRPDAMTGLETRQVSLEDSMETHQELQRIVRLCQEALVWLTLGAPVFFRQRRSRQHGRLFTILKLRTMTEERDSSGRRVPDGRRLTRLGRLLRSTSIDELPELINVLRGEMRLVGPRPLVRRRLLVVAGRQDPVLDCLQGVAAGKRPRRLQ